LFASACTQKSQSEIAIEFVSTGNYELLSNEDRLIYTKDEAWGSLSYLDQVFDQTSKYFELEKFLIDNMSFKQSPFPMIDGTKGHKKSVLKFDISSITTSGGDTAVNNVDTSAQSSVEPGTNKAPEVKAPEGKKGGGINFIT
jgi:hypothetical protein